MRWSWPIGRLFGIPLRVHVTFPLLLAWIAFSQWQIDRDAAAVVSLIGLILTVFAIVVLHELGHALAARRYGVKTRDITLLPIGGLARLEHIPKDPKQELVIALAGPAVNVVIAAVLGVVLVTRGGIGSLTDVEAILAADPTFDLRLFALRLVAINVWLVVFNLLPAFPMDGGRVLRALLSMKFGNHAQATAAAAAVGARSRCSSACSDSSCSTARCSCSSPCSCTSPAPAKPRPCRRRPRSRAARSSP
jgi:Zn-dependent protease